MQLYLSSFLQYLFNLLYYGNRGVLIDYLGHVIDFMNEEWTFIERR